MAVAHGCRNISSAGQRKSVNPPTVLHHCASLLVGMLCTRNTTEIKLAFSYTRQAEQMHPRSPLVKLCVTTVFRVLWFIGNSTNITVSIRYVSLAKLPLFLFGNAKRFQYGGRCSLFSRVFVTVWNFCYGLNFWTKFLACKLYSHRCRFWHSHH